MDEVKRVASGVGLGVNENIDHIMCDLLHLPHKIQRHHEVDDLAHLVLHDLAHDNHFGLNRAIYLVDNPEFNCLKGVAGFDKNECNLHSKNMWETPHNFAGDMRSARFNSTMREFKQDASVGNSDDLVELGTRLGLQNPSVFTWRMRHGNHGILLFEDGGQVCARHRDLLGHAVSLLSLC